MIVLLHDIVLHLVVVDLRHVVDTTSKFRLGLQSTACSTGLQPEHAGYLESRWLSWITASMQLTSDQQGVEVGRQ